ncbi:MAG: glycoside hydrolase domain-containing protein [Terracidiphilus sp.]
MRLIVLLVLCALAPACMAQQSYLGFDRNDYPGDALLRALHKNFHYVSFWLNNPPGESADSWTGKRAILKKNGFGFLLLFNGRLDAQLKGRDAAALGAADGKAAVAAALREGFARNVLIFLDQEEGGRLLPEQSVYLFAWVDTVHAAGARAGVYCSGIEVNDESGTISTAQHIAVLEIDRAANPSKERGAELRLPLWIAIDQCPPSPGCTFSLPGKIGLQPEGPAFIAAWQYAQSPRRRQFSAECPANAAPDGNCYAPDLPHRTRLFVDLDMADSPDPSEAQ